MKKSVINFIPPSASDKIQIVLNSYPHKLVISSPRKTKLGDFRVNRNTGACRISVNNDLNQYAFLVTLLHELAHYYTYLNYSKNVKPHGKEWKYEFSELLKPFMTLSIFPLEVLLALKEYIKNPKASSCSDETLYMALDQFNTGISSEVFVSEFEQGESFEYGNRGVFKIIKRLRKRILCQHLATHKRYVFQPITKVRKITSS